MKKAAEFSGFFLAELATQQFEVLLEQTLSA